MHAPILTIGEQSNIASGPWFSRLSSPLQEAILARAIVRRLHDGAILSARGSAAEEWCGVALGAVRVSSVSLAGKQVTLTYVEPGTWFGDISLFDGMPRTHDAHAHGATTLLVSGARISGSCWPTTSSSTTPCCGSTAGACGLLSMPSRT
jgi:hypothetical protein